VAELKKSFQNFLTGKILFNFESLGFFEKQNKRKQNLGFITKARFGLKIKN